MCQHVCVIASVSSINILTSIYIIIQQCVYISVFVCLMNECVNLCVWVHDSISMILRILCVLLLRVDTHVWVSVTICDCMSGREYIPRIPCATPTPHHITHPSPMLVHSDIAKENTLRQTISTHWTRPGGANTGLDRKYQYSPPPTGCFFKGMSLYCSTFIH